MIWEPRHPRRLLRAVGACAALFLMGESRPGAAVSAEEDCRVFHQECTDARAAGYVEAGICNVERLECPADRDVSVSKRPHEGRDDDGYERERALGERSIGP